ncbi:hypothetical protein ACLOJK_025183 [Asimina triloba]
MGAISVNDKQTFAPRLLTSKDYNQRVLVEEVHGLLKVYKDGHVDRPPIVPAAPCSYAPVPAVASADVTVDHFSGIWARFYVPKQQQHHQPGNLLPLLIYFHGGGFCVGSASWRCYHEFLATLASEAGCLIMSVEYRLAPENRLPAAFDDGVAAVKWVQQQTASGAGAEEQRWWASRCNFSRVFLGGDSSGACLAYNAAARVGPANPKPLCLKGMILIQPFFGGEARAASEKNMVQTSNSALSLAASDTYWRLALPVGANRDHPFCNPLCRAAAKLEDLELPPTLVCVAEMDILKDRNVELCGAMKRAGKTLEMVVYSGVGHAFQILHNSPMSRPRTSDMISRLSSFINR